MQGQMAVSVTGSINGTLLISLSMNGQCQFPEKKSFTKSFLNQLSPMQGQLTVTVTNSKWKSFKEIFNERPVSISGREDFY